ncbi:major facilitator superfamily domain-containing protein [Aspergillus caelatus]|uniref:Major facilitator superfamily domain-containing protein n=1 Tax=Aspergillus caelatus TaxID=61420 RepID=A0A5N6ZZI7_9EURO|nr:major facilitator superfamily domain-containing protein [Aspergillus caelatus]KAE8363021.1 major facilitator superfamily domain-containing protein [Aspergillus caelatus]
MDEPVVRYELQPVQFRDNVQDQGDDDQTTALRGFSLPPVDKGKDAWLCLVGACLLEMTVWGFPFSFGVFQDYYTTTEPFAQYASRVSLVGSCSMGILYLASPFSLFILQRWPGLCRISSVAGLVIAVVGILSSAFATTVWQLLATQGIIYPIGACTLYYPVLIYIDEWFVRRKGLAYGICWAGSGLAGIIFPFIVSAALSRYSYRTTVCAWAVIMVLLVCPFLPFVKPRTPVSAAQVPRPQIISFQFMWSRPFLIFQLGSIVQSLGYFAPTLYLPTYSRLVVGESGFGITAPLTLMNAGTTIGFILMGFLVDRWHVANVIFLATVFTVLAVFAIWGMSVSLSPLLLFAIVYGIFAGSASATWPGIVQAVKETEQNAPTGIILGLLTAGRGVGSIACGPISELLINAEWPFIAKPGSLGYGTNFGSLIVFTGVTAVFGALGFVSRRLGVLH